jgi:hypothetical protein
MESALDQRISTDRLPYVSIRPTVSLARRTCQTLNKVPFSRNSLVSGSPQ